ncbi:unnamed protein product [Protopolystoma xenopodis]|uniref:Uncharacterized protein n=1 Tax=Protopolystoma xenopodis TaxID=117903 RepID=A0A448WGZ7_9PLAT|nr:unnamed protein product [Protopolystoma xenopodis]
MNGHLFFVSSWLTPPPSRLQSQPHSTPLTRSLSTRDERYSIGRAYPHKRTDKHRLKKQHHWHHRRPDSRSKLAELYA